MTSETEGPTLGRNTGVGVEGNELAVCVNTRIGAARAAKVHDGWIESANGTEQLAGDGARGRLAREPAEGSPVVGDGEQHARRHRTRCHAPTTPSAQGAPPSAAGSGSTSLPALPAFPAFPSRT